MHDAERARHRLDPSVEGSARHGVAAPRGLAAAPGSRGGRFGRLFGSLPSRDPGEQAVEVLVERMKLARGGEEPNSLIPAGYTYLAQFVDHDITFDPTSKLQRDNDPLALVNFRTPRFDLDSLYGSGPADQPFLYDWRCSEHPGVELLVGHNAPGLGRAPIDLPRNVEGRAMIGDARNDENAIVSQLHLLFLQFHNKVVKCVHDRRPSLTPNELFDEAQRIVRWHYQWIVVHDLLDRLVGADLAGAVRPKIVREGGFTRVISRRLFYAWQDEPAVPVEFSGAAFRFGHSMVRRQYVLRDDEEAVPILPAPGHEDEPHLGGFRWLLGDLEIDWTRFFGPTRKVDSLRIDHCLAAPLFSLPPDGAALARLNLQRGRALGLPSGVDVARAMGAEPLTEDELLPPDGGAGRAHFWPRDERPEERAAVLRAPPLWFYVLRESASFENGDWMRLGPIGGRIVGEVLVGLLEGDPSSYLRQAPAWTPEDCAEILGLESKVERRRRSKPPGIFTMADLVGFAAPPADAPDS